MNQNPGRLFHCFVCTHGRTDGGANCHARGGAQLKDLLKAKLKESTPPEQRPKVRVNASGCLGHCEKGIAVALYPHNKVWTDVKLEDADTLVDLLTHQLEETLRKHS